MHKCAIILKSFKINKLTLKQGITTQHNTMTANHSRNSQSHLFTLKTIMFQKVFTIIWHWQISSLQLSKILSKIKT